ncbi:hypothetical protein ACPC5U_13115 [Acinetobacter haemolyticus]|uniref:hypothetical protein n=1 Tax=Acinetobacter haemolyticus TaxID=29430 RepID=UPI001D17E993|nr:hypothetical protein [Acinetobacter haemolyticus]
MSKRCLDMNIDQAKMIIAFIALAIAALSIVGLFFVDIPERNRDLVNIVLGAIIGWGTTVFGFYFGDSDRGRKRLDEE